MRTLRHISAIATAVALCVAGALASPPRKKAATGKQTSSANINRAKAATSTKTKGIAFLIKRLN